ncbi:capsular exopolysaccharide family [Sphingomonas laterariae]|uniref:non-specific protein-tyrosine kinase n=1 Tax=Edaphosphingomonas laterariae TaxID=861865 RepID=A0A239IKW6_9SPHN|nr:Wzz/FepE/Etk N-terminal domain-containing protein [Sphingomonas laterariae]SNS94042.1 capsular exopolysaccharide family [Sphingomonas laterariae]
MNSNQIVSTSGGQSREVSTAAPTLLVQSDRLDLSGTVSFFRRRLRLMAAIVALAVLAGAAITFTRPTLYTASSVVSVETPQDDLETVAAATATPTPTDGYIGTQVEIIESRQLATQVAQDLGLLKGRSEAEQRAAIDELQRNVTAFRRGESYTIEILASSADPRHAALVGNAYAEQFTRWEQRAERNRKRKTIDQIAVRLRDLRAQAHADTEKLQHYRIATNMLSTSGASLAEQEISGYNQAVTTARAEAAEDQARLTTAQAQLRSGSTGDDVGEALGSVVISALRARESEVGGEVARLRARYGPNHPDLIRASGELTEIERQIDAEIGRVISNLQARQRVSQQRLASLTGSLSAARQKLSHNNQAMVGLSEFERQAQASQELYEAYLNSYKKLLANEDLGRPNARIISMAVVPTVPSSPNVPMNMILSVVIGIGLALVAAIIAESLFNGVTSSDDVQHKLGLHFLGSIPLLESVSKMRQPVAAIIAEPRSAFTESFRSLRTSIEHAIAWRPQVIAVTSALPREGKSTISACLAEVLAMGGARTVVVDCDWLARGTSRLLDLAPDRPGLIELLDGRSTLSDVLVEGASNLSILPVGAASGDPEPLLTGNEFERLIQELRGRFEYVVLDLPPILPLAATRIMAGRADATIMAVRWRETPMSAVRAAIDQMPFDRVNLIGITMSHVDMRRARQYGSNDVVGYYYQRGVQAQ